jgi:hypothetical protein
MRGGWRRIVTAIVLAAGLASGCAYIGHVRQAPRDASERARNLTPPAGKALVYIVRPAGEADAVRMPVTCEGKELGTTGGRRFIYAALDPGSHVFISRAGGKSELPIVLEAGRTYYLEQKPTSGFPGTRSKLVRRAAGHGGPGARISPSPGGVCAPGPPSVTLPDRVVHGEALRGAVVPSPAIPAPRSPK